MLLILTGFLNFALKLMNICELHGIAYLSFQGTL